MIRTGLAGLAIAGLLGPALIALAGGADFDVAGARVSWFVPLPLALALLGALGALALEEPRTQPARGLLVAAVACFLVVAAVAWSGGIRTPWFRVTDALRPALAGLGALAFAALLGAKTLSPGWATLSRAAAPALVGMLLLAGVQAADARLLTQQLRQGELAAPRGRDVIVLLLDTLRADALGYQGASPSPSPYLDELAARSVAFRRAFAQAPWTFPSVVALFTSRHPSAVALDQRVSLDGDSLQAAAPGLPQLPQHLRERGYRTAGFYKNPYLAAGSGVERGFQTWERVGGDTADGHSARQLVDAGLRWARALARERAATASGSDAPFFLYLHFMDPHLDYQPPPPYLPPPGGYDGPVDGSAKVVHRMVRGELPYGDADLARLHALYRGSVSYLDSQLRRLERELRRLGVWTDDTFVVVVADHGEQLGEHGEFEHGDMHVENLHVPLLFHGPGLAPRAVEDLVRQVDVAPTLLELLAEAPLPGAEGRSLAPLLRGETLPPLPVFSELGARARVTTDRFSLLRDGDRFELYDTVADPGEREDLAARAPERVAELRALLEAHERRAHPDAVERAPERPLDAETEEQLRALGYL